MTIKFGKKTLITLLILLIVAAIYNVIYFAVPWKRELNNAAFWVTYGCTWFALVFAGIVTGIAFGKKDLKSRVFGIPIFYVGYCLLVLQLVIDFVVMGVGSWYTIEFWIPLIIEVLVFGVGTISVIARTAYRDEIDKIEAKTEPKKAFIKEFRIEVDALVASNGIDVIKSDLESLAEKVRYTDPISSSAVSEVEDQLVNEFELLQKAISDGEADKAKNQISKISNLLDERKARLKANR